jgi:hypothetical protein
MFTRGVSVFSATFFALLLLTGLCGSASGAQQIYATSYDLYNGDGNAGYGNVTLYDDLYPSIYHTTAYHYLSGGLGDLTDGIAATQNWSDCGGATPCVTQNAPYIGWQTGNLSFLPYVTFHFAPNTNIDEVMLYSNNGYRSDPVDFLMTGGPATQSLTSYVGGNNSGPANLMFDFTNLGFTGDTLRMTFHYHPAPYASDWILLSEVQFFSAAPAIPEPESYAMLLAGLGLLGFVARRRKQKAA